MDEKMKERLSALVDEQTSRHETDGLIKALHDSGELSTAWERYHLISEVIKGSAPDYIDTRLGERIAHALEKEPTVLAPTVRQRPALHTRPWFRQLTGAAIAASVTAVAILAVTGGETETVVPSVGYVAETAPAITQTPAPQNDIVTVSDEQPAQDEQQQPANEYLAPYLLDHAAHGSNGGFESMMPYAQLISEQNVEQR